MLEVFTVGGGEYIVNVFNAVAAWSGGGGYRSMLQVVMVMGLAYSLLVVAFSLDWRAWLHWFLQSTMIYMMLLVPTVTVKVTDRIDPSLAPATVANVPLGLGVMASFTSQIGDWLTRTAETVFVMPNALQLSNNGIVYGARLLDKAQTFQITNSTFRANLDEHIKQCVFYDVLLGFKSMDSLSRSDDLWEAIGPGSPARAQRYMVASSGGTTSSTVIPCQEAYNDLSARWAAEVDNDILPFAKQAYPNLLAEAATAKLKTELPVVAQQMHGTVPPDPIAYLKQVSMIDAFRAARESFSDASWDAYASQRAEAQARNTYTSIAQQAMTWVPLLNIVLTAVFYAMFPVIFPLFLFPRTGPTTLKGYASGFFYLAAWGPLYVVLHMFVMSRAADALAATAPTGPTLLVTDGIQAVNNDVATIAGFLMMSVPFLAAGMARGALAIAGQATSMLAPAQQAAEAAAVERTTGNYAYGNTSFANSTANMLQSSKWENSPAYGSGIASSSFTGADGSVTRSFSDGSFSYDSRGALSYLPNRVDSRSSVSWTLSQMASEEQARANRISQAEVVSNSTARSSSTVHSESESTSRGTERQTGSSWGTSHETFSGRDVGVGTRIEQGARFEQGGSTSQQSSDQQSSTSSDSFSYGADGRLSGTLSGSLGLGGGGGGGKGGPGASLAASGALGAYFDRKLSDTDSSEQSQRETVEGHTSVANTTAASRSGDSRQSAGERTSSTTGTYGRDGDYQRSDATESDVQSRELRFSSQEEKRNALEQSLDRVERLNRMRSQVESGELQISGDVTTPVASRYEEHRLSHPDEHLPPVWATHVSPEENLWRETKLREIAAEYLRPTLNARAAGPEIEDGMRLDVGPIPSPSGVALVSPAGRNAGAPADAERPSVRAPRSGEGGTYDGRRDAAEHGMEVKPGARIEQLDRRMAPVIDVVAEEAERLGLDPRAITSGDDSRHTNGSRHYDGQGLDFRGKDISVAQGERLAQAVRGRLGEGYYVDFEDNPRKPENNHLHVQTRGPR